MNRKGFTLIELLIVVLIIAILAAIAIPNFMEFQTRAKVSRVKSDFRTLAVGLEAYCVDEGTYPALKVYWIANEKIPGGLHDLTTPIAYMTSIPMDQFMMKRQGDVDKANYEFGSGKAGVHASGSTNFPNDTWMLESTGPDNIDSSASGGMGGQSGSYLFYSDGYPWVGAPQTIDVLTNLYGLFYDPTNGTASRGQLFRSGGASTGNLIMSAFRTYAN